MPLADWIPPTARIEAGDGRNASWSTIELARHVGAYSEAMARATGTRSVVGLLADNAPQWIAIDLAAQAAGTALVPLPAFFSAEQLAHAVRVSGMNALFCDDARSAQAIGFADEVFAAGGMRLFLRTAPQKAGARLAREAQKITFTSGTTGTPKGVVISTGQQLLTARGLASALATLGISRHLCALPLPVLLENVAGVYTALALGATCICPALAEVGLSGAIGFNAQRCLDAIARHEPHSLIVLPQMLQLLVERLAAVPPVKRRIASLKFVAVGGAKTPAALIGRARALGLPVYEGYGLTECASVVSVNVPAADRVGSVGRPLPGVRVRTAPDGELLIAGRPGLGYLGDGESTRAPWLRSGDLGAIDADGYISITGRRTNVLVTSFGRNISPEWPESLLLESPLLAQAAVFGDACPALVAVLVTATPDIDDATLDGAVAQVNSRLPDYARISDWIRASEPFSARNGLATANGRIRRDAVSRRYANELHALCERARISS